MWNKIKKNFIESFNLALDKTEELTSVGRIKLEILQIQHKLDEKYAELGKTVFDRHLSNGTSLIIDGQIVSLKEKIEDLVKELDEKERELGRIKEEDGIDLGS